MERAKRGDRAQILCTSWLDGDAAVDPGASGAVWSRVGLRSPFQPVADALVGMKVGESKSLAVPPKAAFGRVDPELLTVVDRAALPADAGVGDRVRIGTGAGPALRTILSIEGKRAVVDGNHPFAGAAVHVRFKLMAIDR